MYLYSIIYKSMNIVLFYNQFQIIEKLHYCQYENVCNATMTEILSNILSPFWLANVSWMIPFDWLIFVYTLPRCYGAHSRSTDSLVVYWIIVNKLTPHWGHRHSAMTKYNKTTSNSDQISAFSFYLIWLLLVTTATRNLVDQFTILF